MFDIDKLLNRNVVLDDFKLNDGMAYAFSYKETLDAYKECIKNKKNTVNAMNYAYNSLENTLLLCDEINNCLYTIGKSIAFIVIFPKLREVFAADFRDRIVHHLVMNELMPLFEREFIPQTYSCRVGKGVLYGVNDVYNQIYECSDGYKKDAWILKMDMKSFFMSIDKQLLADMLDTFIILNYGNERKKECLRWLVNKIVLHHPENNCEKHGTLGLWNKLDKGKSLFNVEKDKGLPIGNLTSQIFANFYMNPLDHFIKNDLGFRYYGRYVDDFVIISDDKKKLKDAVPLIEEFAGEKLLVNVHPDKRYFQHYKNGVNFIGAVLKPERKYILKRTAGSLWYKMKYRFPESNEEILDNMVMTVNSYLGFMCQYNSYNIRKQLFEKYGLFDEWSDLITIDKNYKKIGIKNKDKIDIEKTLLSF